MDRRLTLLTSLVLATATGGCTVVAGASRAHSGATSCMSSRGPSAADILIGSVVGGVLMATLDEDDSSAWYAIPIVFLTSGILGSISAYSCRSGDGDGGIAQRGTPEQYNESSEATTTSAGDDPAPGTRDATPEETGITTVGPKADLRLDPSYRPKDAPSPAEEKRIACHVNPLTPCPENESCVLVDKDHGYCVTDC